jgi:hypothetical protein
MSHRAGKRKKAKGAKAEVQPEAESPKKRTLALLLRRPVTLVAIAGLLLLLVMTLVNGRTPPRITLINRTGEPLREIRVEYPGGVAEVPGTVADGGKGSLLLRPNPADPKPPGSGQIKLTYHVGDGPRNLFVSRIHGQAYGAHDVLTIVREPDGKIVAMPEQPGGGGFRFRDILRRVGINL